MPFDPDGDLYTAEPKLLSIDCFPIFFPRPAPPDYDLIMAANTRYQRVPEERRPSVDSTGNEDLDVLLIDPHANDDGDTPPNKEHRFRCYPTVFTRLICIILFITSFVLLIIGRRQGAIPAIIFVCIGFVRNIIVILHHIFSKHLRLRLEFRNRSPRSGKPRKSCPEWVKHGRLHLLLDVVLLIVLIITAIIAATQSSGSNWRYGHYWENTGAVIAGLILDFVGILFYAISVPDLGKPSNIAISGGISFNYGKNKRDARPEQPQMYRDVEASGGIGIQPHKTGADSPVVG